MSSGLSLVIGWLHFLSVTLALGAVAGRWVLLTPRTLSDAGLLAEARRTAARLGTAAGLALVVSMGLIFARQLTEFRDPFSPVSGEVRLLLGGTPWGTTWLLGTVAAVLVPVAFGWAARGRRGGWSLASILALGFGAFPALTGHANAGDLRGLTLPADILHVWAVGAWVGGLAVILTLEITRGATHDPEAFSYLPALVPRFSPLAVTSVAVLGATGLLAAWIHLPTVGSLWTSAYGRLLLLKLALVGVVLGLGAINFKRLTPRLDDEAGRSTMRRAATIEFLVANLVLAITALLTRTAPM